MVLAHPQHLAKCSIFYGIREFSIHLLIDSAIMSLLNMVYLVTRAYISHKESIP